MPTSSRIRSGVYYMKIGAYSFGVTGDIARNFCAMEHAVALAAGQGVRLLAFPECALTGYPPLKTTVTAIDFSQVEHSLNALAALAVKHDIYLLAGSARRTDVGIHNAAFLFGPDGREHMPYGKRALWGWDRENFIPDKTPGVYEIDGYKIGVRICFEVRFPEYFRELYRARTDLNLVLFCDVAAREDLARYELIRSALRTRAMENTTAILSVNDTAPYQTAPTAMFLENGAVAAELPCGEEGLLIWDFAPMEEDFSMQGRRTLTEEHFTDEAER